MYAQFEYKGKNKKQDSQEKGKKSTIFVGITKTMFIFATDYWNNSYK